MPETEPVHRMWANLRTKRGLTLRQVAEQVGVSATAVWKWESGASTPSAAHRASLEAVLRGGGR